MLGQLLSAVAWKLAGNGILSTIGRFAGQMIGNYLENSLRTPEERQFFQTLSESFSSSVLCYGDPISLIFGFAKVEAKIFCSDKIHVKSISTEKAKYYHHPFDILHKQKTSISYYTNYEYYISCAFMICEGEIEDIIRVWTNGEIIDLKRYNFRLYKGSEDQLPDELLIKLHDGVDKTPAFRDFAYIVFEELPLIDFGNMIPKLSFEVLRKAQIDESALICVEDMINSMVMIPGSGEFVYDTKIQYKYVNNDYGVQLSSKTINMHNYLNIADSIHSLNQLQQVCPNIEWISVVVCWFGNDLDASKCIIRPYIEFNDSNVTYSEEWRVGRYNRYNSPLISKDQLGNPNYGGTVSDESLLRYLDELRLRGIKVALYPMVFLDVHSKPWRGHITCRSSEVADFFHKDEGYNQFILHYANLCKDKIDAILIGSEYIGLTKIINGDDEFPAVNEFLQLAQLVKDIVGNHTIVT